ncbi:MAG TPA: MFS transporter [Treponemataceae bacterium]|nr:MFS transporter [Treponemataceae bacterium]HQL05348.1 MFS transporter [Treponemataceae bacterium]
MNKTQNWKKNAVFFLGGQTLSLFGSSLVQYAMMWRLTLDTQSGFVMTGYIIAGFLPAFVLSPFAGVWADRYDRKKIIAIADAFIAVVSIITAVLLSFNFSEVFLFFTAAALRSLGNAVHQPAVGAFLPRIVPKEQLTRVNGINGTLQSALMLVSPIAAGSLLAVLPMNYIFLIDALTALLAISVLIFCVHEQKKEDTSVQEDDTQPDTASSAPPASGGFLSDFKGGLSYIKNHRYLLSFFAYNAVLLILVSPAAFLTPLQTARSYGSEVWRLTSIEIVFSVGMMIGGGVIAAWGGFKNRMKTILSANTVMAFCTFALGLSPFLSRILDLDNSVLFGITNLLPFIIYLFFMGIFGIALPLMNTPATVMLQEHIEDAYLGRVFSIYGMLAQSLMPLSMLIFGPLADAVSIELILVITGAVMLTAAVITPLNKRLMEAGEPV